jgi:hypothetical protein
VNETRKTLTFAAVAAVLAAAALMSAPRNPSSEVFSDQGKAFYPDFTDPLKAAALEVVEFLENSGEARPFKVELKDGKWSIPSHHNYAADAKDRLAKTAAGVIDLRKDAIRSDRPQDHELLGVIDPLEKGGPLKGRGKRVTLKDRDGNVLADFIFGKETRDGSGAYYVRVPGKTRTYAVKRKVEISAKFEDWIETDLLQLSQYDIRKVAIDNYSIDEDSGTLKDRKTYFLARDDSSGPWKVSEMKETEEPNTENISAMMSGLDDLKIVGVRPKPAFLGKDLKAKGDFQIKGNQVNAQQIQAINSLKAKGFYVVPLEVTDPGGKKRIESAIFSNEGEVQVSCSDGIAYTLRFGEILVGEGEEVTAGREEDPKKGPDKKDEKKDDKKGTENRYLMVTAAFDPSLLGAPPAAPVPPPGYKPEEEKKPEEKKVDDKKPEDKKPDEAKPEEKKQDPPEVEKYKKDKEEYDKKKKEHDEKLEKGKKRAQELTDRFAEWYYVISGDLFKKVRRSRPELVKPKEEKKDEKKDGHDHKDDEKKPEAPKPEEKKTEAPKPEAPQPEAPKPEAPKSEAPKPPDAPKATEAPKPPDVPKPPEPPK